MANSAVRPALALRAPREGQRDADLAVQRMPSATCPARGPAQRPATVDADLAVQRRRRAMPMPVAMHALAATAVPVVVMMGVVLSHLAAAVIVRVRVPVRMSFASDCVVAGLVCAVAVAVVRHGAFGKGEAFPESKFNPPRPGAVAKTALTARGQ